MDAPTYRQPAVEQGIQLLRAALAQFARARARKTAGRVRRALASAYGARRHAARLDFRTAQRLYSQPA